MSHFNEINLVYVLKKKYKCVSLRVHYTTITLIDFIIDKYCVDFKVSLLPKRNFLKMTPQFVTALTNWQITFLCEYLPTKP